MDHRQELIEKTLSRLLEWIRAADAKIAPILAIDTSMLGVFAAFAATVSDWTTGCTLLAALAVVPLLLSLLFLSLAAFPRTEGPKGSVLYFEGIKSMEVDTYQSELLNLSEDTYLADLANQCHRNAEIASVKFKFVRISMVCLFIAIIPWLVVVYTLYQGRQ